MHKTFCMIGSQLLIDHKARFYVTSNDFCIVSIAINSAHLCSSQSLILFHYGGCPLWVEESWYSGLALKLPLMTASTKSTQPKSSSLWSSLGIKGSGGIAKKTHTSHEVSIGEERSLWGSLSSFRGRLSYAAVFNEPASEAFIQWLVRGGEIFFFLCIHLFNW